MKGAREAAAAQAQASGNRIERNLRHLVASSYEFLTKTRRESHVECEPSSEDGSRKASGKVPTPPPDAQASPPRRQQRPTQTADRKTNGNDEDSPSNETMTPQRKAVAEAREVLNLVAKLSTNAQPPSGLNCTECVKHLAIACRSNPQKAVVNLEQALMDGSVNASVELAECLLTGKGCQKDVSRALGMLDDAVSIAHPGAMLLVGRCMRDGIGVPVDLRGASLWIERSADLRYAPALFELGEMHESGVAIEGVSGSAAEEDANNDDQSEEKSDSSHATTPFAIQKNLVEAFRCYKIAATMKHSGAQLNLAKLYMLGTNLGLDDTAGESSRKASYWLNEACVNGNAEARALCQRAAEAVSSAQGRTV